MLCRNIPTCYCIPEADPWSRLYQFSFSWETEPGREAEPARFQDLLRALAAANGWQWPEEAHWWARFALASHFEQWAGWEASAVPI